jgi:hypothetical protein
MGVIIKNAEGQFCLDEWDKCHDYIVEQHTLSLNNEDKNIFEIILENKNILRIGLGYIDGGFIYFTSTSGSPPYYVTYNQDYAKEDIRSFWYISSPPGKHYTEVEGKYIIQIEKIIELIKIFYTNEFKDFNNKEWTETHEMHATSLHFFRNWHNLCSNSETPTLPVYLRRPRIDYRISEYVFKYIRKNIVEPNKRLKNLHCLWADYHIASVWSIGFSFVFIDKAKLESEKLSLIQIPTKPIHGGQDKLDSDLVYNTENTKYGWKTSWWRGYGSLDFYCYSTELNENIKPREYANIVYNMIGTFLLANYKSIKKESMDKFKSRIDFSYIENFKYPASFNDQKYH